MASFADGLASKDEKRLRHFAQDPANALYHGDVPHQLNSVNSARAVEEGDGEEEPRSVVRELAVAHVGRLVGAFVVNHGL